MPSSGVKFWRELSHRYNLIGKKCGNCGTRYFPPRAVCVECGRQSIGKMEDCKFQGTGEVLSYTVVHTATKQFDMQVPYIMAIIQLDEGPRLTGQIVYCEPGELKIGERVRMVFRKIGEEHGGGVLHYGYKFRPETVKKD